MTKQEPKTQKVFIVGPGNISVVDMFLEEDGFEGTRDIQLADIVVFTGGADIDPSLYKEKIIPGTRVDFHRDKVDVEAYEDAFILNKFMIGICRGAQFLNVMNEGKLWQDVDGHTMSHMIERDKTYGDGDYESGRKWASDALWATSTHHQMMIPHESGMLLAWGDDISKNKKSAKGTFYKGMTPQHFGKDPEVVWYKDSRCLCFQPHPEYLDKDSDLTRYFFNLIRDLKEL